ncbi:MAG: hypothetical protein IKJ27_03110 [Clostridia bacterium]|nr:hypothetical protein [Clostridia bacterium]
MSKAENKNEVELGILSEKEKEMLDLFDNLDTNGRIAAIHSFYSLVCSDLLESEGENGDS